MTLPNYRAIDIIPGNNCTCPLSKQAGKRILYSEVIELLKSSQSSCTCTFQHYEDRRHTPDRRTFDIESMAANIHGRTRPYGRRLADIHNRARDPFTKIRMRATFEALQQAG